MTVEEAGERVTAAVVALEDRIRSLEERARAAETRAAVAEAIAAERAARIDDLPRDRAIGGLSDVHIGPLTADRLPARYSHQGRRRNLEYGYPDVAAAGLDPLGRNDPGRLFCPTTMERALSEARSIRRALRSRVGTRDRLRRVRPGNRSG